MAAGLDRIRREAGSPSSSRPRCWRPPSAPSSRPVGAEHVDRTDRRFVTLDPASSIDLDQALRIEHRRATTSCSTTRSPTSAGSCARATRSTSRRSTRGVTVYLPDRRSTLYPHGAVGRCGEPAARRRSAGGGVHGPRRRRRHVAARRRRAGDRAQPRQARLRLGHRRRSARTVSPSSTAASRPPSSGVAPRASSSPSRTSSVDRTATTCCASGLASRRRSRTRRCRWPPTWRSPTRCSRRTPGCSG